MLLTGLLIMDVADVFGGSARTVAAIGAVRVLHGLAAGLALPAALAWPGSSGPWPRAAPSPAALWVAATVDGLSAVLGVLPGNGWPAAAGTARWPRTPG